MHSMCFVNINHYNLRCKSYTNNTSTIVKSRINFFWGGGPNKIHVLKLSNCLLHTCRGGIMVAEVSGVWQRLYLLLWIKESPFHITVAVPMSSI